MTVTASSVLLMAFGSDDQSRSGDPGPGLTAFLIVLVLLTVCGLLARSMLRHLRRVPRDLDVPTRPQREGSRDTDASAGE